MESKKNDTNELTYKTDTDSQTENKLRVTRREGLGRGGINLEFIHILLYKIDNQQGPTVLHKELFSIFCDNL